MPVTGKESASPSEYKINAKMVSKLKDALKDASYKEMMEGTANINTRIAIERKIRLPFLDQQTNLAQVHSILFMSKMDRLQPRRDGQLCSYPAVAWYKKRRQYLAYDNNFRLAKALAAKQSAEPTEGESSISMLENSTGIGDLGDDNSREASAVSAPRNEESNHSWLRDEAAYMDEGQYAWEEPESDFDDERDDSYGPKKDRRKKAKTEKKTSTKTKGSRKSVKGSGGSSSSVPPAVLLGGDVSQPSHLDGSNDNDKPYCCEICGARYKTRPGLSYHYSHSHGGARPSRDTPSPSPAQGSGSPSTAGASIAGSQPLAANEPSPLAGLRKFQDNFLSYLKTPETHQKGNSSAVPNSGADSSSSAATEEGAPTGEKQRQNYCDFCLGNEQENKKTNKPEEMISCADCGRSGHPSCLQFTDIMTKNVKKYRWQCIECKTCTLCGTSENDDQLLFCDDCDRGYHMYCLSPPLQEPPEGSWSCHLCQKEITGNPAAVHTAAGSSPPKK